MRPRTSRTALVALSLIALVTACATKRTETAANATPGADVTRAEGVSTTKPCDRSDQDSSSHAHLPLYRACAVDVRAKPRRNGIRPDFQPTVRDRGCYSVVVEMVVDTAGGAEPGSARVLRTNDTKFAQSVLFTIPTYRFEPARIGDAPVRQIYELRTALMTRMVRTSEGGGPQRPMPGSRPPCL